LQYSVTAVLIEPGTVFIVGNTSYTVDHPIDFYQVVINESWIMFNDFKFTDTTSASVVITGITDDSISFTNDSGSYTIYKPKSIVEVELTTVNVGDTFTLNVTCYPAEPVKGWELGILYDKEILSVTSVYKGTFFDGYETFTVLGVIDNMNGTISNIYELIVGNGNVSQAGVLVGVVFKAITSGEASIRLYNLGLCNETMYLNAISVNGSVIVAEEPEPEPPEPPIEPPIEPEELPEPPIEPPIEPPVEQPVQKPRRVVETPSLINLIVTIALLMIMIAGAWLTIS